VGSRTPVGRTASWGPDGFAKQESEKDKNLQVCGFGPGKTAMQNPKGHERACELRDGNEKFKLQNADQQPSQVPSLKGLGST
jgi:hypothetical protein